MSEIINRVLPFHPAHLVGLKPIRQADIAGLGGLDPEMVAIKNAQAGPARSYFAGHRVIAIIGMVPVWFGVGEIWLLTTDEVSRNRAFFHRATIRMMREARIVYNLHRLQATVHDGNELAKNWIERLGFEFEGRHKQYGPDKSDHLRYAKTWPE